MGIAYKKPGCGKYDVDEYESSPASVFFGEWKGFMPGDQSMTKKEGACHACCILCSPQSFMPISPIKDSAEVFKVSALPGNLDFGYENVFVEERTCFNQLDDLVRPFAQFDVDPELKELTPLQEMVK